MKRSSLIILTLALSIALVSCTKSAINNEYQALEDPKERPEDEFATITGRINPSDVNATIVAWNDLFIAEGVPVTAKDGSFNITVPAFNYYHLTIRYTSPTTGASETFERPKVIVTANSVTDVGEITLQ